jgi:hypothetical protein
MSYAFQYSDWILYDKCQFFAQTFADAYRLQITSNSINYNYHFYLFSF